MSRTPHPKSPGLAADIDEAMITRLVHAFYARVRSDETLAPIFDAAIKDWDPHLATMCRFWSSVTLMTGQYKGQPMQVHARLDAISPEHFAVWLRLFRQTAGEVCPPAAAAVFIERAERIAESLQLGIAFHRGESIVPALGVGAPA